MGDPPPTCRPARSWLSRAAAIPPQNNYYVSETRTQTCAHHTKASETVLPSLCAMHSLFSSETLTAAQQMEFITH